MSSGATRRASARNRTPLGLLEVAVEEAREDAVEARRPGTAARARRPDDEARVRDARAGDLEHRRALVEPDDLAAEVLREEPGAAGDVERPRGRQRRERRGELVELVVPAGPLAVGEEAAAEPPVVVLRRPPVVVLLHGS